MAIIMKLRKWPIPLYVLLVVVWFFAPTPAGAQTWTGANSNDWDDSGNWSGGVVPSGGTVRIGTTATNPTVLGVSGAAVGTSNQLHIG